MSNCKFQHSFRVCSLVSARLRQVADEREFSPAAVSAAWREAEVEFEKMFPQSIEPAPAPVSRVAQPPVPFEDRPPQPLPASYVRCRHGLYDENLCEFCRGTGAQEIADLLVDDEQQMPEVQELTVVEEQVPVAGQDDPEAEQEEPGDEIADESGLTEVEDE